MSLKILVKFLFNSNLSSEDKKIISTLLNNIGYKEDENSEQLINESN